MREKEITKMDCASLCLLLREAGSEVYQWERFKIGVYALTKNMPDTKKENGAMIFHYKFEDLCYEGMTDRKELGGDMDILEHNNFIERLRMKKEGFMTDHDLIKLLPEGEGLATEAELYLSPKQIYRLKEISKDLKYIDLLAEDLLYKYGKKWSEKNVKYIIKSFPN